MSIIEPPIPILEDIIELRSGDRMTRQEFHRVYSQMPENFKAELIGGIVYVASPLRLGHSELHKALGAVFYLYESSTSGVHTGDNATVLLDDDAEPQPDLFVRIRSEFGGQSRKNSDDYLEGAPELVAEVAYSSRAIDLHVKRSDYMRNGVREYLVACVGERQLRWFNLQENRELAIDADGICKVTTFPGLWIDATALFANDSTRLIATLQRGLATREHTNFVAELGMKGFDH